MSVLYIDILSIYISEGSYVKMILDVVRVGDFSKEE